MRFFNPNVQKMLEKQDVRGLIKALTDADPKLSAEASDALVKIGSPAVEPLLIALNSALDHLNYALRRQDDSDIERALEIIRVLGCIGDNRAVEPLIGALKSKERPITLSRVRRSAAYGLGQLSDQRAVEPLMMALKDLDKDVRGAALSALEQLGVPVQKEKEIESRKEVEGHAYLVVLWSQTPPTGLEVEQIGIGMRQQLGLPINHITTMQVGSMPTYPDEFVISTALLVCKERNIPFDSKRDEIAYRSGMGLGIVTIKIKPSTP
ncbi:MAG: hypothetical protein A2Z16_15960 [Chloroflexi bacterium RBG_16_54_18]|nr:MAG: hypothetical protein A2Z16_15960 [Chloroflexi bacterium RBG_16_54_18]